MKKLLGMILVLLALNSSAAQTLESVEISGNDGGRLNGDKWESSELVGKVHVVFYVDPDEKETNEHVGQALKNEKFSRDVYQSWAIINMAATWLPNFALESALKKKQKTYPDTVYVKDLNKVLVKKWQMEDDASNVLVFNKQGELIYKISGKASDEQIKELLSLVKANL